MPSVKGEPSVTSAWTGAQRREKARLARITRGILEVMFGSLARRNHRDRRWGCLAESSYNSYNVTPRAPRLPEMPLLRTRNGSAPRFPPNLSDQHLSTEFVLSGPHS